MEQEYQVPPMVFPGMRQHEKAYAAAYDLLARRAPEEALGLLEPALEAEPENTGLRTLRAWAWMIRAQLGKAEEELRGWSTRTPATTGPSTRSDGCWSARGGSRSRCRTCGWPR